MKQLNLKSPLINIIRSVLICIPGIILSIYFINKGHRDFYVSYINKPTFKESIGCIQYTYYGPHSSRGVSRLKYEVIYSANGSEYRCSDDNGCSGLGVFKKSVDDSLLRGGNIPVFYDVHNPSVAYLDTEVGWSAGLSFILGWLILVMTLLLFAIMFSYYNAKDHLSASNNAETS